MKAQFLTETDIQIARLGSEIMFQSQMIESLAKENARLTEELKQAQEINNAHSKYSELDASEYDRGQVRPGFLERTKRSASLAEEAVDGSEEKNSVQDFTKSERKGRTGISF